MSFLCVKELTMKTIKIGLIGTGYIGRCHAIAYAQAPTLFPLKGKLQLEYLAEINQELAEQKAQEFGFARATDDWRKLVADPDIDVVDICTPNFLHKEIALEAIKHGKHVYSEKPLALTAADAKEMVEAAKKAGVKTLVGFNYIKTQLPNWLAKLSKTAKSARWCISTARTTKTISPTQIRRLTGTATKPKRA